MVVYTVYEPPHASGDPLDRALKFVFVKDGFQWLAALFLAVWLLFKGLWLEFLGFLLVAVALTWGMKALGAPASAESIPLLILQVAFGFEAGWIQSLVLERRGWRMAATVTGRDEAECERRFFETWLPAQPATPGAYQTPPAPSERGPTSWTATMMKNLQDGLMRSRSLKGAKA